MTEQVDRVTGFIGSVVILATGSIVNGFTLSILWGWFLVPALGIPPINIPQAIGIALVVLYLVRGAKASDLENSDTPPAWKIFLAVLAWSTVCLGIGWIVQLFL